MVCGRQGSLRRELHAWHTSYYELLMLQPELSLTRVEHLTLLDRSLWPGTSTLHPEAAAMISQALPPPSPQVMEMYQPSAIVVCGGADSLSGDKLGCFNLSMQVWGAGVLRSSLGLSSEGPEEHTENMAACVFWARIPCVSAAQLPLPQPHPCPHPACPATSPRPIRAIPTALSSWRGTTSRSWYWAAAATPCATWRAAGASRPASCWASSWMTSERRGLGGLGGTRE